MFFRLTETKVRGRFYRRVRIVLLRNACETYHGMRAMLFRIPLLLDAIVMRKRERESMDRWLVVADGRPTVIVPGNRKRVITLCIEWKIVRRRSTIPACIPGCVYRPAFAAIPTVSMLHGQLKILKCFHLHD